MHALSPTPPRTMPLLALVAIASLTSCAKPLPPQPSVLVAGTYLNAHIWEQTVTQVRPIAAFELACPAEQLEMTPLDVRSLGAYGQFAGQIGVSGCNKRRVYVDQDGRWVPTGHNP